VCQASPPPLRPHRSRRPQTWAGGRTRYVPCSGLTPEGLAQRPGGGDEPPRQSLISHADTWRVGTVACGHTSVERRVRRPAPSRVRVRTVIVRTAAAREAAVNPVQARWNIAVQPTGRHVDGDCNRTRRHLPGPLTTARTTGNQSAQEAQECAGGGSHGIPSSVGRCGRCRNQELRHCRIGRQVGLRRSQTAAGHASRPSNRG
jgi:hypothetical protein